MPLKMTIHKLERLMWRLRKKAINNIVPNHELEICIMYECGTSRSTYKENRRALIKLGWIISHGKKKIRITDKDLQES